jgi:hypothetical protein
MAYLVETTPARITVTRHDGSRARSDVHGAPSRSFDRADTVEKFHRLAEEDR